MELFKTTGVFDETVLANGSDACRFIITNQETVEDLK